MMTEPSPLEPRASPTSRWEWLDIVWYLLGGLGLYMLVGALLEAILPRQPQLDTLLKMGLNFTFLAGSAYVLGVRRGKFTWEEIGLSAGRWRWRYLGMAAAVAIGLFPLRVCLGIVVILLSGLDLTSLQARQALVMPDASLSSFLISLLGVGVLAPFSEELFFRGALYSWFRRRYGFLVAAGVSSIFFALAHIDNIGVVASSLVLGFANAWLLERTRTIWTAVATHAINNSLAVLILYVGIAAQKLLT